MRELVPPHPDVDLGLAVALAPERRRGDLPGLDAAGEGLAVLQIDASAELGPTLKNEKTTLESLLIELVILSDEHGLKRLAVGRTLSYDHLSPC